VVSMRLFVKRLETGQVEVEFAPLEKEMRAAAPHLAQGIENALVEGRDAPTVNILTTQAAGITRIIGSWLESAMKEATGRDYRAGQDFYFNFTPSRVAPGDTWVRTIRNFPQLIGPINRESARKAFELYSYISVEGCHIFPNPESAEQNKTFENAHDDGNIAMVNASGQLSGLAGTNTFDIVRQINKRPNRQARDPGNGVGGYCYPKDPYFLSYSPNRIYTDPKDRIGRMLQVSVNASLGLFFQTRAVNNFMPYLGAALVLHGLDKAGIAVADATVTIAGIGYKEGTDDTRMSPSFDNIAGLIGWDGNLARMPEWCRAAVRAAGLGSEIPREIRLYDPFARRWEELRQMAAAVSCGDEKNTLWKELYERGIEADGLKAVGGTNAILLAVRHEPIRALLENLPALAAIMGDGKVIVDGRNMLDDDAIKLWLALDGTYLAIAKGEAYVDLLADEMDCERELAGRILAAVRPQDRKRIDALLAEVRATVRLPEQMQTIHENDVGRARRLRALSTLTADNLDYHTWLALGGKYLVAAMSDRERTQTASVFK
jgi:UDP-N-acetyl-D-mannosaminuronate dehydrogenase